MRFGPTRDGSDFEMRPVQPTPVYKDVVLIGGGHSHVEVLRRFGMTPRPGVRLTLITNTLSAPYSGMIPGFVSGHYSLEECHIDLSRLATFANARIIMSSAVGIDSKAQRVELESFRDIQRPSIPYDVLSINVGITPATSGIPGVEQYTTPVKPISALACKIDRIFDRFVTEFCLGNRAGTGPDGAMYKAVVVGGGAGGVELACALQYRLNKLVQECRGVSESAGRWFQVVLVSKGPILGTSPSSVRQSMVKLLEERDIRVIESDIGVTRVEKGLLHVGDEREPFDDCLWCTRASPPSWFANSDLQLDDDGYIVVDEYLTASDVSGRDLRGAQGARGDVATARGVVFGAGDCVTMAKSPRPKAGVYAVRAGPIISNNIFRVLDGHQLKSWTPQSTNLSIISCGDRYALMSKMWLSLHGGWVWSWKDQIDRKFMNMYGDGLRDMGMGAGMSSNASGTLSGADQVEFDQLVQQAAMRCGGCGSKVGASLLSSVLAKLGISANERLDDAAFLPPVPHNTLAVQTIDYFKCPPLLQDPFIFGYISAIHAMSDCYAMNGTPTSALALAVIPFASPRKTEEELYQLMAGASAALLDAGCKLIGGHTSEGAELAMGLSVTGHVPKGNVWEKKGMNAGDDIIMIKALGTGVLMAAAESGLPVGGYLPEIVSSMCQSNRHAHAALQEYSVSACTDVTGFGLLGHLVELCRASSKSCIIFRNEIPVFPGAIECLAQGITSSLAAENDAAVRGLVDWQRGEAPDALYQVAIDPQTSGGLLFTLPSAETAACLAALKRQGFASASRIGVVTEPSASLISFN